MTLHIDAGGSFQLGSSVWDLCKSQGRKPRHLISPVGDQSESAFRPIAHDWPQKQRAADKVGVYRAGENGAWKHAHLNPFKKTIASDIPSAQNMLIHCPAMYTWQSASGGKH